eukprot:CAMPEP_0184693120 /NCGR_PEP_ID=MMETSP0313-20130426/1399_1 /TAXON_ID=2792 /ORGANISM="Porphyridium aerugineum, Strain SAG 1380-2" /LENGTH=248 /DNA_ID=CAMNT_0027151089 /DNA_START=114 /DNA_END=860 /DNA_ORIENTATION=-
MAFVSSPVGIASNQNAFVAKSVNKVSAKPAQASIVMMGNDYLRSITQKTQGSVPASNGNGNGYTSPSPSASASSKPASKAPLSYSEYMKLRGNNATTAPSASSAPAQSSSSVSRPSVSTGGEMNYLTALEKKTVSAPYSTPAPSSSGSYLDSIKGKPSSNGASYTPTPAPVSSSKPSSNGKAPLSYEEYMKSRQGGASASSSSSSTPSAAGGEISYLKALEKRGTNSASSNYSPPSSGSYLDSISRRI